MLRIAVCSFVTALLPQAALAQQEFQCAGATVTISVDAALPLRSTEGADVILRIDRGSRSSTFRFSGIDFIGGACDTDANNAPRIIFQAVCGGSGCYDSANWGIIDSESLQALVVPANDSLNPATALLGHRPALTSKLMSVSGEAHRLGLPTP